MADRTGKGYFVKGRSGNPAGRLKNPPEHWFNPKYLALFAEKRPEVIARISRLVG
jgi:hypothetical protein